MTIFIVSNAIWAVGFVLALGECFRRPPRLMCDCRGAPPKIGFRHLKPTLLFLTGLAYILSGLLDIVLSHQWAEAFVALLGVWYGLRWWWHTKQNRKKLKDKALGVVRQTAAGLKVVAVPVSVPQGGAS